MKSLQSFKHFLGPKATERNDKDSITLQKKNLDRLTKEYHGMSKDEGGSGMAKAHGDMFANTKKNIHKEDVVSEDGGGAAGMGAAPTATVAGIAGSGDSRLPASQREPGVSKKHNPIMSFYKRKPPKA
jgi:hypothetical protein